MANDTDKILKAIEGSTEELKDVLSDHEKRIRGLETVVAVQGWKIGAIVAVMVAFGGITINVVKQHLADWLGYK